MCYRVLRSLLEKLNQNVKYGKQATSVIQFTSLFSPVLLPFLKALRRNIKKNRSLSNRLNSNCRQTHLSFLITNSSTKLGAVHI